jgi:MmeI, target recognition domain
MKAFFSKLSGRYITGSRTQRWPFVFTFVSTEILPGDKRQTFAFDDDYSFGVIASLVQLVWYQAKAARLKNEVDYNYSTESVYDTFPWPQFDEVGRVTPCAPSGDSKADGSPRSSGARGATRPTSDAIAKIDAVAAAAREVRRVRARRCGI